MHNYSDTKLLPGYFTSELLFVYENLKLNFYYRHLQAPTAVAITFNNVQSLGNEQSMKSR